MSKPGHRYVSVNRQIVSTASKMNWLKKNTAICLNSKNVMKSKEHNNIFKFKECNENTSNNEVIADKAVLVVVSRRAPS